MTTLLRRTFRRRLAIAGFTLLVLASTPSTGADLAEPSPADAPDPTGTLTLRAALGLALARNAALQGFAWEVRARDAHALQAGRLPNPQLHAEVENVGGSGDRQDVEDAETTVRLSQLIELGGKRGTRRRLAELGSALASWDYEAKRLQVLSETS